MTNVIEIKDLSYRYNNKFKALDNISIKVPKGAIYGFLGPNGAGKSTTMRMLAGLMHDDHNNIQLFEKPINSQLPEVFSNIGCLVEQPVLYTHLTAKDHLELIMNCNGIPLSKLDATLEVVGLSKAKNMAVKRFSLGMKQRLAIALCLVKEPQLLLLDEPVNGLDPNGMQEVREMLVRLNQELGITIFISSHLLSEIEKMCTHICIINKGKIHFEGTMPLLKKQFDSAPVSIQIETQNEHIDYGQWNTIRKENKLIIDIQDKKEIAQVVHNLITQNIDIYEVKQEGNLESWFLDIIQ